MSNIASYPLITPKGGDLIIGSETYDATLANPVKGNPTRNFSVSSVVSTQIPSYIVGTTDKIPVFTGSNKIQDSIMTETAAGGSFTGKYISISAAGGGLSTQKLEVNKALIDGAGSTGTDGFLLSSTTVGGDKEVAWINTSSFLSAYLPLAGGTMSGAIAMGTNKITGLGNPTSNQDAGTKTYIDTADALRLNLSGGTMSGPIVMDTNKITGLGNPTAAQDAGTKTYIDTADALRLSLAGGTVTGSVTFTSVTPITLSAANPTIAMGTNNSSGIIGNDDSSCSIQIYGLDETTNGGEIHIESRNNMSFSTNGSERLRIKSDGQIDVITGPLEIEAGNLILEAGDLRLPANKGIYFGGNTTSAYELDYYEEGTFTPTAAGSWEADPTQITGMFTRVGNKVTINVKFKGGDMAAIGNGYLQGLPFAPKQGDVGELFTGSVIGDNYIDLGVAAVKYDTDAAGSRIYFSTSDFIGSGTARDQYLTITYLVETA